MDILLAGDFVPRQRVSVLIESGQYEKVFTHVQAFTSQADYSIVNFESPVVEEESAPIEKTGPNLKCSEKAMAAVQAAGFNCVTLANNHFYDFGEIGVRNTLSSCRKYQIDHVGGGMSLAEASGTLYKNIAGKVLAIINVCEHEWSIATPDKAGSAPMNPIQVHYQIKKAREKAAYVIVITHGGTEHYNLPTPRMKETYRFFIDSGADAVVNHHQHCYSGYEQYREKPIFYGLGNFCFDGGETVPSFWTEGFMLKLKLDNEVSFDLIPYVQCSKDPSVGFDVDRENFEKKIKELNSIIEDDNLLQSSFDQMVEKRSSYLLTQLEPFSGRVFNRLRSYHLIPPLMRKSKLRLILALFRCEAHRDIFLSALNERISEKKKRGK